jgi:branched-chain amino acid aminotransferase
MARVVYLDGEFVPKEQACVSVFDHGFLYGDGVFEGIRVYNGRVFELESHLERLYSSARYIMLEVPMSLQELLEATVETVRRNGLRDGYIRLVVSRGPGDLGLDPRRCPKPTVVIIADDIQLYPKSVYEHGIELITVSTRKNLPQALNPAVKSLNYLNNILAKVETVRAGLDEGIMLNHEGFVAECTGDNIFIARDGDLVTPPTSAGILRGVTRKVVMSLAREAGIPVREELFTQFDVYNAAECFLTGTAAEIVGVVKVDGRLIGDGKPGPITRQLTVAFRELTKVSGVPIYGRDQAEAVAAER